jgi:hypothetical protein
LLGNESETNNKTTATAKQQLRKYTTILKPLLGSGLRVTMEILLEEVSTPRLYHSTDRIHKHYDRRVQLKKSVVVILKGLEAKTN